MKNERFLNLVKLKNKFLGTKTIKTITVKFHGRNLQDPMVLQRCFFQSRGGTRAVVESKPFLFVMRKWRFSALAQF